jgi:hypothetical protein
MLETLPEWGGFGHFGLGALNLFRISGFGFITPHEVGASKLRPSSLYW